MIHVNTIALPGKRIIHGRDNTTEYVTVNLYDLEKFDLSLLIIFEYIYQHLSTNKTTQSLYIMPSAISQSLQRLRTQFNGPLFTRSERGITPTTIGLNLHHHLEKNLKDLEQTINITSKSGLGRNFIIHGPQLISYISDNILIRCLRQDISIDIGCHDMLFSIESAEELLVRRRTDLAITLQPVISRSATCVPLHTIRNSLTCSSRHPHIAGTSNCEQITAGEFTLLISRLAGVGEAWMDIDEHFINRRVSFRGSSLITIINNISVTDLLGIAPIELYGLHRDFLKLKEIKPGQPLLAVKLYISHNKASLNNLIFPRFTDRSNGSF